jgi:phosphate transport system substrate-binding protein
MVVYALLTPLNYLEGEPDQESNINVELRRADDWRRLVDTPVLSEQELALIDGSTATVPITAELLRQFYGYPDDELWSSELLYHSSTPNAYDNLIYRYERTSGDVKLPNVSLILVTPPSSEELATAQAQGVTLDLTPIATDGFVFIVNTDNPVDSLTVEQIRGIYTGAITNWKQVGGDDVEILPFQRSQNSGSQTAMEQLVMQGTPLIEAPKVGVFEGMGGLVEAVAEYQNGPASIGYTYNYYIENLYRNENIKVLRVNGVTPSPQELLSGAYPFTTSYYAVLRADEPEDSPARRLRDFLVSETGQQVIEMAGYTRAAGAVR